MNLTIKFFILILGLLTGPALAQNRHSSANYDEPLKTRETKMEVSCPANGDLLSMEILSPLNIQCETGLDVKEYCECLNTQARNNIFIKAQMQGQGFADDPSMPDLDLAKYEDQIKKPHADAIIKSFQQMTQGATLQRKLLGMEDGDEMTECMPDQVAGKMKAALEGHYKEAFKSQKNLDAVPPSDVCNATCQKQINNAFKADKENIKKARLATANACQGATKTLNRLENYKSSKDPSVKKLTKNQMLNNLKDISNRLSEWRVKFPHLDLNEMTELVSSDIDFFLDQPDDEACSPDYELIIAYFESLDSTLKHTDKEFKKQSINLEKPADFPVEYSKLLGRHASSKTKEEISDLQKVDTNSCFPYSKFLAMQGRPSPALLSGLASNPEKTADFLNPSKVILGKDNTALRKEMNNFLRSNPLLGQLLGNPEARVKLASALNKFAKTSDGSKMPDDYIKYENFMKNEVDPIIRDAKFAGIGQCEEIGRKLAAVHISKELPPLPPRENDHADAIGVLSHNVLVCKVQKASAGVKTDLESTLSTDPLYMLYRDDSIADRKEKLIDEYKEKVEKVCGQAFKDFRDAEISEACKDKNTRQARKCADTFNDPKKHDEVSKKFLAMKYPHLYKTFEAMNDGKPHVFDKKVVKKLTGKPKENKETKRRKAYYDNQIAPQKSKTIIATRGKVDEYVREQEVNATKVSSVNTNQYFSANDTQVVSRPTESSSENSMAPAVEAGRVEPAWVEKYPAPQITPKSIVAAKRAEDLIQNFPKQTSDEKLNSILATQEALKKQSQDLLSQVEGKKEKGYQEKIATLTDELDDLKEKVIKEKAAEAKSSKIVAESSPASITGRGSNPGQVVLPGGVSIGKTIGSGQAATLSGGTKKSSEANNANLAKYADLNDVKDAKGTVSRGPASISGELSITVQSRFATESEMNDVSRRVVHKFSAPSEASFKNILSGPQAMDELAKILGEELKHKKLPSAGVIAIKSPVSGEELLVSYNKDPKLGLVIKPVPAHLKVDRKFHYNSLINTINSSTH